MQGKLEKPSEFNDSDREKVPNCEDPDKFRIYDNNTIASKWIFWYEQSLRLHHCGDAVWNMHCIAPFHYPVVCVNSS